MSIVLSTLAISMAVQAVFFVFAAALRTDKVTDLSYGLTFVLVAIALLAGGGTTSGPAFALSLMVVLWGLRLAGYLFVRILRMGRDARFDGIREHVLAFAKFWIFQGVAVWVIMLPVTLWFRTPGPWHWAKAVGLAVWLAGLAIETAADAQKFAHKSRPGGGDRWTDTGLWRYSRHPNYFGEMLCWWGVFVFAASDLAGWGWVAVIGPVAITLILLFVTGIPTLERSASRKWGAVPEYQAYRRRTRLLIPWPSSR